MNAKTVVVTTGTDPHRFDRLIGWVERYAQAHPDVRFVVQYGASRVPAAPVEGFERVSHDELIDWYRQADVALTHGGPGLILDARAVGLIPIAVPRLPELDEVVDAHQLAFVKAMVATGNAIEATEEEGLGRELDRLLADPSKARSEPRVTDPGLAAAEFGRLVEASRRPPGRERVKRTARRLRQLFAPPSPATTTQKAGENR